MLIKQIVKFEIPVIFIFAANKGFRKVIIEHNYIFKNFFKPRAFLTTWF